jgi:hypothetical protein
LGARRAIVCGLNETCALIDEIAYRPAVIRLTERLPFWWSCGLGRLSARLDTRWGTDIWGDWAGPEAKCAACRRRAAWLVVGEGENEVALCGWCRLDSDPELPMEERLARARERSVGWHWRQRH